MGSRRWHERQAVQRRHQHHPVTAAGRCGPSLSTPRSTCNLGSMAASPCRQPSGTPHTKHTHAPEGGQGADHAKHLGGVHHLHAPRIVGPQQLQHLAAPHHNLMHLGRREVAVDGALRGGRRCQGGRQSRGDSGKQRRQAAAATGGLPAVVLRRGWPQGPTLIRGTATAGSARTAPSGARASGGRAPGAAGAP